MISWLWMVPAFLAGMTAGVFLLALASGGHEEDRNDKR